MRLDPGTDGEYVAYGDILEWTLPSPAPYHSFETPPVVK